MMVIFDELRQGEVETGLDLWPRIHRDAEAGAARLTAIDCDDEGVVAANPVGLVAKWAREKDPVMDGDRVKLAGAHADKGERLYRFVVFDDREAVPLATGPPEPLDWRMQKAFPGMRPDGLPISPSDRKIIEQRDGVVDDRAVAHGRSDDPVPAVRQAGDDPFQDLPLNCELGAEHPGQILVRRSLLFNG